MRSQDSLLFLIRHAESEANVSRTFAARIINPPLSPDGLRDAERIGQRLASEDITRIYSSPLRRALQTAQVIASRCRHIINIIPELQEVNVGILDGKSSLSKRNWEVYDRVIERWSLGDQKARFEGGESLIEVCDRAQEVLRVLNSGADLGRVALVSHAVFLMVFLPILLGDFPGDLKRYSLPRGSITSVRIRDGAVQVQEFGSTEHLQQ